MLQRGHLLSKSHRDLPHIFRPALIARYARFKDMNRLISANKIRPVVAEVFPFERAQEAFEALASQKHVGKIVIKVFKN